MSTRAPRDRVARIREPGRSVYAVVRLSESFLYADLVAGEEPDVSKGVEILRLLLR